jgi:Fe-S oxidoreductase
MRRYLALTTGDIPSTGALSLQNLNRTGNPWGQPPTARAEWAQGLNVPLMAEMGEVDVLWWVGCAGSYDERNQKISKALVKIFNAASVDYAILGQEETCNGDPARRLGDEYTFQMMAKQNIETLKGYKFQRIVTACPHCFNTFKNEYPQFGGDLIVQHFSEFLNELFGREPQFLPVDDESELKYTYHDSCYLGRLNKIYDQPRSVLKYADVGTVELPRRCKDSFCCGGGGGQMWMETDADTRINQVRLQDAIQVGADTLSTACPYCLLMFDDAIRSKGLGESVEVMDIAEILEKRLLDTDA